jgi:hypothetical protein
MTSKGNFQKLIKILASGFLAIIVLALITLFSNLTMEVGPAKADSLAPLDKARLAEALHLKAALGDAVWPGFGGLDMPVLVWHEANSFLVQIPAAPSGWETVPGDSFQGEAYYRNPNYNPENFAMEIDGVWAASMATKGETDRFIQQVFRDLLPDFLELFFPFRLLSLNSEIQISGVVHESYHVYQAITAAGKFSQAESSYARAGNYWEIDAQMQPAWENEIELLIAAVEGENAQDTKRKTVEFLDQRGKRRSGSQLTSDQIGFEKEIEWLEGLAKYVELAIWEAAAASRQYQPLPEMESDGSFKEYQTFERRWRLEIDQARRQAATRDDVRFYYTGMLQARILDRLMPGWKPRVLEEGVYLEELLREAITP